MKNKSLLEVARYVVAKSYLKPNAGKFDDVQIHPDVIQDLRQAIQREEARPATAPEREAERVVQIQILQDRHNRTIFALTSDGVIHFRDIPEVGTWSTWMEVGLPPLRNLEESRGRTD